MVAFKTGVKKYVKNANFNIFLTPVQVMAGKRKADPKTAVKSKAAKAKAAAATDEAGKPSRETTSGFLTSLKYKSLHGKGNDKVNAQQLLQAGGFLGLGVCAAGRVEVSVWGLVFSSSVFRGLGG